MIAYRNYLVLILAAILTLSGLDSVILSVSLHDIKQDLHVSDSQLGVLTGIAFALFYAVMGIPIARWADRGNRVFVIALTAGIYSVMVTLCGAARTFVQLLVIQVGVAIGEAGCMPAAQSLISDYFSRAERPRAFAAYMLGFPATYLVGYLGSGWLNQIYGWRAAFFVLGVPGLALTILAWCTLREPRTSRTQRTQSGNNQSTPFATYRFIDVVKFLSLQPTMRHLLLYSCVSGLLGAGMLQWQPAFFVRSHGMQTGEIGTLFALAYGVGGFIGMYAGGRLASRYAGLNEEIQFKFIAIAQVCYGLVSALAYLCSGATIALVLLTVAFVGSAATYGPNSAVIQTLVPERMRATALASMNFCVNLIGLGFGPLIVGFLSDAFRPWAGNESLRYALVAMCPGFLWAGWHAREVARTVRAQLAQSA